MWKMSGIFENRKFRILVLLEAVLLMMGIIGLFPGDRLAADENTMETVLHAGEYLAERQGYYIDGSYGYNGVFLEAKPGILRPGVYLLRIVSEAGEDAASTFGVESESGTFRNLLSNPIPIYKAVGKQTCRFYVCGIEESAKITVNYEGVEALLIKKIELIHTNAGSRIFICLTFAGSALINTLMMLYCYMKKHTVPFDRKLSWFGVPGVAILASIPLFVDYTIIGDDLLFHLTRIEALAQSIAQGSIPARVEAMWLYGHGYANSIFYCDTFLTLPAMMRLIGFHMNTAYNTYVFAVNFATAVIAYLCFKGCFRDRVTGVLGSMLYTLVPYRIYNIYNRCAVGEYTAMTFLPLLVYGFYRIFTDDVEQKEYKRNWLFPVLGFSGLIQSHVLSCEIIGGFIILLCLILIKKVLRRQTFLVLAETVFVTVVFNLWFLLPFFDMMLSGKYYFSVNYGNTIQKRGILPANIFDTMQAAGGNCRFDQNGLLETDPIGVGMAVLLGAGAFWVVRGILRDKQERKEDQAAVTAFFISVFALTASTVYFPWNAIQSLNKVTAMLVPMLQFPMRLTIVPAVCMVFVVCAGAAMVLRSDDRFWKIAFCAVLCGFSMIFSLYQTNDILVKKGGILRLYTVENMGNTAIMGGEYLPEGAVFDFSYGGAVHSDGVEVLSFEKNNLDTVIRLDTDYRVDEHWLDLPMLLYKGYRAQDMETGEIFAVQAGENQSVRVLLPGGYSGTLHVWYAGMWYWRVAELISLLVFAGIIWYILFLKFSSNNCHQKHLYPSRPEKNK